MATEHSAGGILYTIRHGVRLYAVVTELDGHTGLPKGHIEAGESPRMTALREIREETGIRAALHPDFEAEEHYALPHGGDKTVTYYLAVFRRQNPKADFTQIRQLRLLPLQEALALLTFPGARRVLQEADAHLTAAEKQAKKL